MKKNIKKLSIYFCLLFLSASIVPLDFLPLASMRTSAQNKTKEIKIRGYVTKVNSPTSFEIDNYLVSRTATQAIEFENPNPEINFKPEDIRIGTEMEVRGDYNAETNELKAKKIKINLSQFKKFKTTTILSRSPEGIEKTEQGWRGTLLADGNLIRIESATQVLFELNKIEKKKLEEQAKQKAKEEKDKKSKEAVNTDDDDEDESVEFAPLSSLNDVKAGMLMIYEGTQQLDGTVLATRVVFIQNETAADELELWNSYRVTEKPADLAAGKAAEIKIEKVGKFKLLPDEAVQNYISRVGQNLIPAYQKTLADNDPLKIPFKFLVVIDKDPNAFALPNGMVVINSGLFDVIENEAHLAYVISHEIAHATQEHTLRQMNKDKKKRAALKVLGVIAMLGGDYSTSDNVDSILSAMTNGYQITLENQADRVGLDYLIAAGYDPREALQLWHLLTKKQGNPNVFWSSHENNLTRRSFLMYKIHSIYSDLSFEKMTRGNTEEFQKMSQAVVEAAKKVKK